MLNWYILCKLTKTFIILHHVIELFPPKCAFSLKTVSNILCEKPIKCSSDLTVCFFPLTGGRRARGGGMSTDFSPPPPSLRVHGQTSQSIWENLVGTNKLIGLSSKYVFPPHASLGLHTPWGCGFTGVQTQTHNNRTPRPIQTSRFILSCEVLFIWGLMSKVCGLCWVFPECLL